MTPEQSQALGAALGGTFLIAGLISLALIVFAVIIYWRIFAKAGYSGALGLLMFVPIANLIMLCVLAFGEWPIYRELNMLRQQVRGMQMPPQGQQFSGYQPQQPQQSPFPKSQYPQGQYPQAQYPGQNNPPYPQS